MAEFTVRRGSVRVPAFEGYGAQFNQNVFAQVTADEGVTQHHCHKLEDHVKDLGPQFVRIFFNRNAFSDKDLRDSFQSTVSLAQKVASTINVTWAGGGLERPDVSHAPIRGGPRRPREEPAWNHGDTAKLEGRLKEVREIVRGLPEAGRRPLYITEYGVRGFYKKPHQPPVHSEPGVLEEGGARVVGTNVNAFQHAWFNLRAAQRKFHGLAKWDAYFGKYDLAPQPFPQEYGMIGRPGPGGWKLRPSYELTRLFTHTVKPRWNVIDVDGPSDDRLVVGFEKPGGALTVIGLDTRGGLSNSPPSTVISYELGGLPLGSVFAVTTLPPPVLT